MPLTTAQYNALNNSGGSGSAAGSTTGGFGKWASDNSTLIGALGAGLGGILGLKGGSGDTQGSSGYQGGIPEYTYNPTIKDNAFANTYQEEVPVTEWYTNPAGMLDQRNVPGATTSVTAPRRPGSMGRNYFDYPTTGGLYSPVTTTTDGVTTNNILGGDYLATANAAATKAAADQAAYNLSLGQAYMDAYGENYGMGEEIDSTLAEIQADIDAQVGGSGSVTVDTIPNIGGTASTIGSAPTVGGVTTVTETPAVAASVAPGSTSATTTGGTSDLYNYLRGMGFGETERNITADDVAAFGQQSVFTLGDIATALGTDSTALLSVANYTAPTALQTALGGMGFAVPGGRNITANDISTLTDAGYAVEDVALALDVTTDQLNSISSYTAPTTLQTALSNMDYDAEGGKVITAGDISTLTDAGYALADIATALDVTTDQLNSISSYTAPTALQTALSNMDYDVEGGKVITAGDISTLTDAGYALADIATALDVTTDQLNSVVSYEAPNANAIALNNYLVDMGYSAEDKDITKADVQAWQAQDTYTLAAIADALGTTEAILISISNASAAGGLLEGNQGYYLGGPTDGMADNVPATIDGAEPARLSDGEFVVPADVVSHLGNGNSEAGSEQLYSMMDRVRQERTGTTRQGAQINPMRQLPA